MDAENTSQPLKTLKIKNDQPWMTIDIKKMIEERQRLYHRKNRSEWKDMSNKIKFEIRKRKKEFFRKKYVIGNPNWWKEVNQYRSTSSNQSPIEEEFANSLNEGFYKVWNGESQPNLNSFIKPCNNSETFFTHSEIIKSLESLKISSTGPDGLSARLLKSARLEIADTLVQLFNSYINQSFVPSQWKFANITPIPKIDNPKDPGDYRPISVTSILSKVFERILCKHIIEKTKNIWKTNKQHGSWFSSR